ncbi:hypothetical protein KIN20_023467, partial [Parelaphostrongylus tenuis]
MPRPLASSNSSYQTGNEDGGTTVEENGLTRKQIQNIFYVSLLIKDGHVRLSMDDEQLHVLFHINIAREPVDRLLSHYYFLRFGDNFRIGLKQSRAGNNETFNECVLRGGHDCDMKQMWLQIPYFSGHHHFCT